MQAKEVTLKVIERADQDMDAWFRFMLRRFVEWPGMLVYKFEPSRDIDVEDLSGYECDYDDWEKLYDPVKDAKEIW
jgi:hypothetical protein